MDRHRTGGRDGRLHHLPDHPRRRPPAPAHLPGQYVSVQVELPDGARQIRQYSLSTAPGSPVRAITVKRVHGPAADGPDGEVSHHLHTRVRVGDTLRVSLPCGDLTLEDSGAPVLLASAGIGCTPMLSMLEHLAETGHAAPVTVLHADRSPADHALRDDHRALTHKLADATARFWYEEGAEPGDTTGLMDLSGVTVAGDPRVPVRAAPLHARGARAAARQGRPGVRRPLRGVRPRPVARLRMTAVRIRSLAVRKH